MGTYFSTYCPFGHHWLTGSSTCSLLRLNLLFVAILLFFRFTLCSRRIFLLLLSTHRKIVAFPQFVLIFAAKLSAIILGVQNAAAAVWFGSTHTAAATKRRQHKFSPGNCASQPLSNFDAVHSDATQPTLKMPIGEKIRPIS